MIARAGHATARARSSSARGTAWPSGSPRATSGRWAAAPTASGASRLREDDEVVAMEVVAAGGHAPDGLGERLRQADRARRISRAVAGRCGYHQHPDDRPERPSCRDCATSSDEDELMLITQQGKILRMVTRDVRTIGRATQGVRLIEVEDDDRVVSIARLAEATKKDHQRVRRRLACIGRVILWSFCSRSWSSGRLSSARAAAALRADQMVRQVLPGVAPGRQHDARRTSPPSSFDPNKDGQRRRTCRSSTVTPEQTRAAAVQGARQGAARRPQAAEAEFTQEDEGVPGRATSTRSTAC